MGTGVLQLHVRICGTAFQFQTSSWSATSWH